MFFKIYKGNNFVQSNIKLYILENTLTECTEWTPIISQDRFHLKHFFKGTVNVILSSSLFMEWYV